MDQKTLTDNEDNLSRIRKLCDLAELIHDEWTRLLSSNANHSLNLEFTADASEMNNLLMTVKYDVLRCIDQMLTVISRFPRDVVEPVYSKIKRRSVVQVDDLIKSLLISSDTDTQPAHEYCDVQQLAAEESDLELMLEQEARIRNLYEHLRERLNAPPIAIEMYQCRAINLAELQAIKANRSNPCKAVECLLDILMSRWKDVGRIFLHATKVVNQHDIYLQICGIGMNRMYYCV